MEGKISKADLLKRVKATIKAMSPDAEIILYGSRARGTARADSDWDFLILLPDAVDQALEMRIKNSLYDIELETGMVLSSIVRSKKEWFSSRYRVMPLRKEIEKDGIAI